MSFPSRFTLPARRVSLYACLRGLYDLAGGTGERRLTVRCACRTCGRTPIVVQVGFTLNRRGLPVSLTLDPVPEKCPACGEILAERTVMLLGVNPLETKVTDECAPSVSL